MKRLTIFSLVASAAAFSAPREARAQVNDSCNLPGGGTNACLTATNTAPNSWGIITSTLSAQGDGNHAAIVGNGSSGPGIYGVSGPGEGVEGFSTSSTGVKGNSSSGNGVMGITFANSASGVYGENDGQGYGVAGRISPAGNGIAVYGDNTNSSTGWSGYFTGRVNVATTLYANQTCVAGFCSSDIRLKKNVQPLTGALDRLVKLRPVTFEWKNPEEHMSRGGTQKGFIAQEVEQVMPEWVGVDDRGFKTLDTRGIEATAMLVDSIRTLKTENDALRARVTALENKRTLLSGLGGGAGLLASRG